MKARATIQTTLVLALGLSLLWQSPMSPAAQEGAGAGQTEPTATSPGATAAQPPAPAPTPSPSPGVGARSKAKTPAESLPKRPPRSKARAKHRARGSQTAASGKVVVPNGGASERAAQLTPAMSQEQARAQRENTTQLMDRTDSNLKQVAGRELTPAEQSMIDQIHTYLRQAKDAEQSGDVTRAHTLAYKAELLSNELAHR